MYGIPREEESSIQCEKDEEDEEDIESAIQKELDDMKASQKPQAAVRLFTPITTNIDCVFFMKALPPIEPAKLALQICEDAKNCADIRKRRCRYINRLTPVVASDKATDNGIIRIARQVLAPYFQLNPESDASEEVSEQDDTTASIGGDAPHTVRQLFAVKAVEQADNNSMQSDTTFEAMTLSHPKASSRRLPAWLTLSIR